jgi:hypothetical protein
LEVQRRGPELDGFEVVDAFGEDGLCGRRGLDIAGAVEVPIRVVERVSVRVLGGRQPRDGVRAGQDGKREDDRQSVSTHAYLLWRTRGPAV